MVGSLRSSAFFGASSCSALPGMDLPCVALTGNTVTETKLSITGNVCKGVPFITAPRGKWYNERQGCAMAWKERRTCRRWKDVYARRVYTHCEYIGFVVTLNESFRVLPVCPHREDNKRMGP